MGWMRPVPWLRWLAAAVILVAALARDLSGPATEPYPFSATHVPAGTAVESIDVVWRTVPAGLFPDAPHSGDLAVDVGADTPLHPAFFSVDASIPPGWWIVSLPLHRDARPGAAVRVVVLDPPITLDGVVAGIVDHDTFDATATGPVAVPGDHADVVARAVATGDVVTLLAPPGRDD